MSITKDTRVFLAASIGSAIQIYNFVIYILLSSVIALTFFGNTDFKSLLYTYIIFAAGYFVRPIGGCLFQKLGEYFGMKSTYLMTMMLMAFSTVFMGSLPSYVTFGDAAPYFLLFFRLLQGIAFGGEIPSNTTLVFEHISENKKLMGCTIIVVGFEFGLLLATCVAFFFTNFLTHEELIVWGWRPPFFIGAILAAIGFYLRYLLTDTPEFEEDNDVSNNIKRVRFINMIKNNTKEVIVCFFINVGVGMFISIFCLFMPIILNKLYGFNLAAAYDYGVSFMIVYMLATVLFGYIVRDLKIQPKILFIISSFFVLILIFAFVNTIVGKEIGKMLIIYILLACALGGCSSMLPNLLSKIFTEESSFSGISFSYNIAQAIGSGLIPICMVLIFEYGDNLYSVPALAAIATMFIFIGYLFGINFKNKDGKKLLR